MRSTPLGISLVSRKAQWFTASVLMLSGCIARGPYGYYTYIPGFPGDPNQQQTQQTQQQTQQRTVAAGQGPQATLSAIDASMRAQGYQLMGQAQQQTIPNNMNISFQIATQPNNCYMVVALGDQNAQDVDLRVFSQSGREQARDTNPDNHPTVPFCPAEYGYHVARVHMFRGNGNVVFAVYQGPAGTLADANSVFQGQTQSTVATAQPAPTTPDPATAARIAQFQQAMTGAGYSTVIRQPTAVVMRTRETQNWAAQFPPGWCYTLATFAGPGVRNTDLFLRDGSGTQTLAGDNNPTPDAAIQNVCPADANSRYQIQPSVRQGTGPVWFVVLGRPNSPQTTGATVTQTQVALNVHSNSGSSSDVEGAFNSLQRDLTQWGYSAPDGNSTFSGSLTANNNAAHAVTLQGGTCYAIAATGEAGISDLNIAITDASGTEIDHDYSQDSRPIVRFCPQNTGQYNIRVQMAQGEGQYQVAAFRWSGGTSGAGMQGLLFVRNAEVSRMLQVDGYEADLDFDLVRGRIAQNASSTRTVNLQANRCYAFLAVGGQGVSDLDMVIQRNGSPVAQDTHNTAFPNVRTCIRTSGTHQVVIHSRVGAGEFAFRVFRTQENNSQPTRPN